MRNINDPILVTRQFRFLYVLQGGVFMITPPLEGVNKITRKGVEQLVQQEFQKIGWYFRTVEV